MSGKVVIISTTLGVLAAGTGISLAATQGSSNADAVTCIVVVDAKAAVDANSALSDVFPVGTPLHLTSAGREVDVTVSAPLTAAAPATSAPTTAPATTAPATTAPATTAPATSAPASAPAGGGTASKPPKKHHRHHKPTKKAAAKPTTSAAATESNAEKAAQVGKVSVKADANKGVDPNTVCVELSKNAFNTLGNVANGNNVGAFIATMTPTASAPPAGNGGGAAATSAPASSAPAASASASTAAAGNGTTKKKHHH